MNKKFKVLAIGVAAVMCVGLFAGCGEATSTTKEKAYQEEQMQQASSEIGMPKITEFYEKKMAKEILELRDDSNLVCYAYNQSLDGKYVYVGKCMGYGLPYSTQYTNPERKVDSYDAVIPQADPNGLYSGDGLSATWLMMIDEATGERKVVYMEPELVVTQQKLPRRICADWSLPSDY